MTEASIFGQYNDVLFTGHNFASPAMQKPATEEFIAEKVFKYPISFNYTVTAESQKLTLNFGTSIINFYSTVQSIWIQSQEILISAIDLSKLKSTYKKVF